MKVIHFNTNSTAGGAAQAVYHLHTSLIKEGLDSVLLVRNKNKPTDFCIEVPPIVVGGISTSVIGKIFQKSLWGFVYNKLQFYYKKSISNEFKNISVAFNPDKDSFSIGSIKKYLTGADVICFYWIDGFLSAQMIHAIQRITNAPIVWTLLDAEPLTGGCHYPDDCDGFKKSCGKCPQLKSGKENDFSRNLWNRKKINLNNMDITFVAPSSWIKDHIKESSLFNYKPIERILLSVNDEIFRKIDKNAARIVLGLPKNKKIIFFGAQSLNDKRKGMKYLIDALEGLYRMINTDNMDKCILLVIAGFGIIEWNTKFEFVQMGFINDERILALCYQASDVFACPSIDDAGPMMINQSVMCGTPVVAFNNGVSPDLITSEERGCLVKKYDSEDFCLALHKILFDKKILNNDDWIQPDECKPKVQAKKYRELFEKLCNGKR